MSSSQHPPGGRLSSLVHSNNRDIAFLAAALLGRSTGAIGVGTLLSVFSPDIAVSTIGAETSNGYSFVIGLDVMQLLVHTLAARTRPSFPVIRLSTIPSRQYILGPSS